MDAPLQVELLDSYGQRVRSDGTSTILAELVDGTNATLQIPLAICEAGLATFTDLAIFAAPGITVQLKMSIPVLSDHVAPVFVDITLEECPAGMIEQTTSRDNIACSPCEKYTYENQGRCVDCVLGMDCDEIGISLAVLPMSPGYWRADERATEVYACPYGDDACSGGTQVRTCGLGYRGPGCQTCDFPGFYLDKAANRCRACEDGSKALVIAVYGFLIALIAAGALYFEWWVGAHKVQMRATQIYRASHMARLKIIYVACQLISSVEASLNIVFPFPFNKLLALLNLLQLDLGLLPMACVCVCIHCASFYHRTANTVPSHYRQMRRQI